MRPLAVLLVTACLSAAAVAPAAAAAAQVAEVGMVVNHPELQRAESRTWVPADEKKALFQNDWIRTGFRDRVSLLYVSGSEVKVYANTRMMIHGAATGGQRHSLLRLFLGRLWARINPPPGSTTELSAGTVTVSVRGTDLMLAIDQQGRVSLLVLSGEAVMTALGESVAVRAGQQCAAAPGNPPSQPLPAERVAPALTTGKVILGLAIGGAVVQRLTAEHDHLVAPTIGSYTAPGPPLPGLASLDPRRALSALLHPVPRGSTAEEGGFSLAGTGFSVGASLTSTDEAQQGGTAAASVYVRARWQLGGSSSGLVVHLGSALTGLGNAQQGGPSTYAGIELPAGRLGRASLELREWQPERPGGAQRWAVAALGGGPTRFGLAQDLLNGQHAYLLETCLRW